MEIILVDRRTDAVNGHVVGHRKLRPCSHNKELPETSTYISKCNFINLVIYEDSY